MGLAGIFLLLSTTVVNSQELNITFTTAPISGAKYSPDHIVAVWIKDANNAFVRSLMVYANKRKSYLYKWNSNSSGNSTDAVTGATISNFKEYSLTWDMKDFQQNMVPSGSYKLCMEMTSINGQGPYREIEFTTSDNSFTISPNDEQNFKKIDIRYDSAKTGIQSSMNSDKYLKIFPNPSKGKLSANIVLEQNSETSISIYNIVNKLIVNKRIQLTAGQNRIDLSNEAAELPSGVYFFIVETNHYTLGSKLIVAK
jgi:hypothetical protein